ncbi:MAG: hypothetical protein C3F18_03030 [Nitrosomonadales bacterium]|nr:MAG: hypothetical protein C3F18_03030 [Nitrosomonadales bacterium]
MRPRNVELHIEELMLDGFAFGDRYRIAEAVEHELAALFAEQGAPQSLSQGGEIAHLDGGAFEAVRGSKPETVGVKVAQAVYGGMKR